MYLPYILAYKPISHISRPPNLTNVLHGTKSGFLTYTVCEEVMHSDFTPFGAYWLNHIPLDTILLSTVAFHTFVSTVWATLKV